MRLFFMLAAGFVSSISSAMADENAAAKLMDPVQRKHHFAMLKQGLLTAQANWVYVIGAKTFANRKCGENVIPIAKVQSERQEVVQFFKIPADAMATGSDAIAADLETAFSSAPEEVLKEFCQTAKPD